MPPSHIENSNTKVTLVHVFISFQPRMVCRRKVNALDHMVRTNQIHSCSANGEF